MLLICFKWQRQNLSMTCWQLEPKNIFNWFHICLACGCIIFSISQYQFPKKYAQKTVWIWSVRLCKTICQLFASLEFESVVLIFLQSNQFYYFGYKVYLWHFYDEFGNKWSTITINFYYIYQILLKLLLLKW